MSNGACAVTDSAPPLRKRSAICDAGPLIHLDELGRLDFLSGFSLLTIPSTVAKEVEGHRSRWRDRIPVEIRVAKPTTSSRQLTALARWLSLDAGETEAIQLLDAAPPRTLFLTDDLAARLAARILRIDVHGTVGLVVRAARIGRCTPGEVVALLELLPSRTSLHIKGDLLQQVVLDVKTHYRL